MPQTVKEKLVANFGGVGEFQDKVTYDCVVGIDCSQFSATAIALFGSGWAWLVQNPQGKLEIMALGNAGNPMTKGCKPLLTIDGIISYLSFTITNIAVWEHAYYLDHQNRRAEYVSQWWNSVNWKFVEERLAAKE